MICVIEGEITNYHSKPYFVIYFWDSERISDWKYSYGTFTIWLSESINSYTSRNCTVDEGIENYITYWLLTH